MSPTKINQGVIFYEKLFNIRPNFAYLQFFDCQVFIYIKRHGTKLQLRVVTIIYVGYVKTSKLYRYFDSNTKKILFSNNI